MQPKWQPDSGPEITVVGGANLDVLGQASATLVAADSNPGQVRFAPGGVGRNVAENLARLGLPTCLVSAVGNDAAGQLLVKATRAAGVNVDGVQVLQGSATATYLSVHGPDGDMALAVNDMGVLKRLDAGALAACRALWAQAPTLVIDANLSAPALAALFEPTGISATCKVFADAVSAAKCLRLKPWLSRLHLLKVNALEAAALLGWEVPSQGTPAPGAASLVWADRAAAQLQQAGASQVVVTLGAQGVCWREADGSSGYYPAKPVAVANTAGAGDALLAGLVAMHVHGQSLAKAVPWAMACAELTLMSGHANAPTLSRAAVAEHLQPSALDREIQGDH